MFRRHHAFFQTTEASAAAISFLDVEKIPEDIQELYRGFYPLRPVMFSLPTVLTGIFGQTFPDVISIEEIRLHKLTNLSNDYHMVSMSQDSQVASDWGRTQYITVDPTLIRSFIVDVHESFRKHRITIPGRMNRESEHLALAVPYCCIKSISIQGQVLSNPFYLAIADENQEAKQAFGRIYDQFITLLRDKYTQQTSDDEERLALRQFVTAYLQFYDQYTGSHNPFNKTVRELTELHPAFMADFLTLNPEIDRQHPLSDIAMMKAEHIFKEHEYTRSLDASELSRPKVSTTIYDDQWAKPIFD